MKRSGPHGAHAAHLSRAEIQSTLYAGPDPPAGSHTAVPSVDDLSVPCRVLGCGQISAGGNWLFPDGTAECDDCYLSPTNQPGETP